ncbi:MSHA fimbrial biogenesis protein MshQ [Pseudaeromonas pectinilytica]
MMRFWSVSLLSTLCLISQPIGAMTIDYDTVFPTVIQGHTDNMSSNCNSANASTLNITNSSLIKGGNSPTLNICKINTQSNNGSCVNSSGAVVACTTNGQNSQIPELTLDPFPENNSTLSPPTISDGAFVTLGADGVTDYNNIMVDNATLKFSSVNSTYKIKNLLVRNGQAVLYLAPGDYWIENLDLDGRKLLLSESGTTRVFVKNYLSVKNQATLNEDNTGRLVVVGYSNIELLGGTHNGYFYANDRFILRNQAKVYGRATARHIEVYDSFITDVPIVFPPILGCITDDFSQTPLSANWAAATSGGTFIPSIIGGRLQLTENKTNQATSVTYQRLFPAANNLVTIEFDQAAYGGNGADGIAMVLSDATVTPQPGSSGGPLGYGYKTNAPGFAGGWLGVGIDEFGNFRAEGGDNNQKRKANTVSIRGSGSGYSKYRYLFGTDTLNPTIDSGSSYPNPVHRYRLTVDSRTSGQALVTIQRNTGSGYITLIPTFNAIGQTDQAALPANFYLSFTGSTGGSHNIHELDNVRICAITSNPVGKQIDHFEFDHSGQALTCNPEEMTIRACANASCSALVTDTVTAVLSPSSLPDGVWTVGSSVTFTGGSTKVYLRKTTAGSTTIGVTSSTPSTKPLSKTLCRAGSSALSEANCTLTFADSGFVFDVPDTYSNQPQTVAIKAVKKSDTTQQCVPGFASQAKIIKFWSGYINPSANPYNSQVMLNSNVLGTSQASATSVSLQFDAQGQSSISVNYPDAGQVQLDARYDGSGDESGLVMNGSDQFVARPVGLCITTSGGQCQSNYANCSVFKKAGETFPLQIQAVGWASANDADICAGNIATPNFALNNIALGSTLVAPNPGTNATVGKASYDHAPAADGRNSVDQSVSEVGVFKMTATPPINGYIGYTIPPASSASVGRFTPYDFALSNGHVTAGCGSFSYMGQPMPTSFTVTARNSNGGTTRNYHDEFALGLMSLVAENGDNGVSLSSRLSGLSGLSWQAGLFTTPDNYAVSFARNTPPDGPSSQLAIGVSVDDPDDIPLLNRDMNVLTSGSCGGSCSAVRISTQDLRHGRLSVSSGRAAVDSALALPLMMEIYTGSGWQRNVEDACTQLDLQASGGFVFDRSYDSNEAQLTLIDNSATSRLALATSRDTPTGQPTSATAQAGYIWLHFSAPGISDRVNYQLDLSKQPKQPSWLSFDWNGDGVTTVSDMGGWAFFNQWRSSDRVIYRREVLN